MKILRKLIISVVSLVAVVICFVATTYAWFDVNSEANVEGFNFTAISGEGFQVSVDGINYSSDLTANQMKQAIILGYDSEKYSIKDQKIIYTSSEVEVSEQEQQSVLDKILLMPLTSKDGIKLEDMYSSQATSSSGRFVQFNIYFKATSTVVEDNFEYNIYLNGSEITQMGGKVVKPTEITSLDKTDVELLEPMTTIHGSLIQGQTVTVYSQNAMRLSIQDTSLEEPKAHIYELTNEFDLGSYATDYNKETDTSSLSDAQKEELDKLYNADTNAMFTYYNNLRPYDMIEKMSYAEKPETIRSLMGEDLPVVTTVKSGSDAKLITFRLWLEGWDADCFDGLAQSINVKLSFNAVSVNDN